MVRGVAATSISGCGVCTACRVVCKLRGTHYTHRISYNNVFLLIISTIL